MSERGKPRMEEPESDGIEGGTPAAETNRPRRELGRDLLRYLPSQGIPAVISFFTIPILTRLFDPTSYGDYRLVLATVGIFGSASVWIAAAIYRFYPESEIADQTGSFLTTVNRLLFVNTGVFIGIWGLGLLLIGPSLPRDLAYLFFLGMILLSINTAWGVFNAMVRTLRRVTAYSVAVSLNKALTLGLGVALVVWAGMRVDGLLIGSIAGSALLLPMLVLITRRRLAERSSTYDPQLARAMMRYGFPIALMMMAAWMLELGDRFIIAAFRGTGEVGLYSAAYGIAEQGMQLILLMFQLPFVVLGARVFEHEGPEAAARFVSSSAGSYLLLALPAWAGLSVLADPIMTLMTDTAYQEAASIMPLVAGALVFGALQWWFSSGSTFMKKTGQQAISVFVGVVVNVTLNILLVGRFGYQVAAVTTLLAYATAMAVMAFLSRRDFVWRFPVRSLVRASLAAGTMAASIIGLFAVVDLGAVGRIVTAVPLGVAVYGAALLIQGEPEAVQLVNRLRSRLAG